MRDRMGWRISRCSAWNYCFIEIIKAHPAHICSHCVTRDKKVGAGVAKNFRRFQGKESFWNKLVNERPSNTVNCKLPYQIHNPNNRNAVYLLLVATYLDLKATRQRLKTTLQRSNVSLLKRTTHLCRTPGIAHSRLLQLSMTWYPATIPGHPIRPHSAFFPDQNSRQILICLVTVSAASLPLDFPLNWPQ